MLSFKSFSTIITVPASVDWIKQSTQHPATGTPTYVIPLGGTYSPGGNTLLVNMAPGDILELDANISIGGNVYKRLGMLLIEGLKGSVNNPIIIRNIASKSIQLSESSPANYYALTFHSCENIKLSGKVGPNTYNLIVKDYTNTNVTGIGFNHQSRNIEMEYTEIANVGSSGVKFKSEEAFINDTIITTSLQPSWIDYISITSLGYGKFHNNYIHECGNEGFYIGATDSYGPSGDGISINVDPIWASALPTNDYIFYKNGGWRFCPHFIDNVLVYDNKLENTGWDGIQIAMAKNYKAYNNLVKNYGTSHQYPQMYGIIIGAPSIGETYNNTINTGAGSAIQCLGLHNRFYNNLIINPNTNPQTTVWSAINAIYFNDKLCTDESLARVGFSYRSQTLFEASHNTVIMKPGDIGRAIFFYQNFDGGWYQSCNTNGGFHSYTKPMSEITIAKCFNNLAVCDSNYNSYVNYVFTANPTSPINDDNFSRKSNYLTHDINSIGFVNPSAENYNISSTSIVATSATPIFEYVETRDP
ncbi:MAG: hypothetical protein NTU43_09325, partial [Bacteroidetes bacterium]|nr:hypothetical protein [Bacteroidota bacterium]